jgi:hypothetical protein
MYTLDQQVSKIRESILKNHKTSFDPLSWILNLQRTQSKSVPKTTFISVIFDPVHGIPEHPTLKGKWVKNCGNTLNIRKQTLCDSENFQRTGTRGVSGFLRFL